MRILNACSLKQNFILLGIQGKMMTPENSIQNILLRRAQFAMQETKDYFRGTTLQLSPCSEYRCILCNHNPQNSSGISLWIQSYPRCCNGSTRLRLFCIAITYFSTVSCRQSHALYIFMHFYAFLLPIYCFFSSNISFFPLLMSTFSC